MRMSYFYGTQADQFNFIRIPKELVVGEAFASLSVQAKILYGMLLDRMGMSYKNKWLDEENRVYRKNERRTYNFNTTNGTYTF